MGSESSGRLRSQEDVKVESCPPEAGAGALGPPGLAGVPALPGWTSGGSVTHRGVSACLAPSPRCLTRLAAPAWRGAGSALGGKVKQADAEAEGAPLAGEARFPAVGASRRPPRGRGWSGEVSLREGSASRPKFPVGRPPAPGPRGDESRSRELGAAGAQGQAGSGKNWITRTRLTRAQGGRRRRGPQDSGQAGGPCVAERGWRGAATGTVGVRGGGFVWGV